MTIACSIPVRPRPAYSAGRPLLVGEANPHSVDPRHALWPTPPGAAGGRLMRALGMSRGDYLGTFDRANLFIRPPAKWSVAAARARAEELLKRADGAVIVLLGARVASAFGAAHLAEFTIGPDLSGRQTFARLPHPSGRCRAWNEEGAEQRLRSLMDDVLALADPGRF